MLPTVSGSGNKERVLKIVRDFVSDLHPHLRARGRFELDASLETDLAIDSLARMELMVRLEREFGLTLPEHAVVNAETPRDLLRALHGADTRAADSPLGLAEQADTADLEKPERARNLIEVLDWACGHPSRPGSHAFLWGRR